MYDSRLYSRYSYQNSGGDDNIVVARVEWFCVLRFSFFVFRFSRIDPLLSMLRRKALSHAKDEGWWGPNRIRC